MEPNEECTTTDWNNSTHVTRASSSGAKYKPFWQSESSSPQSERAIDYNPILDKHLKFQHQQSHSAPHRLKKVPNRTQETSDAMKRLELQRSAYKNVILNAISGASLRDPSFLAATKKPAVNEVNSFDVFERAKQKCVALWSELDVEEDRRNHFAVRYFHLGAGEEPSADRIEAIHDEIQRSLSIRRLEKEIEFSIRVREGFVYRLLELAEKADTMHLVEFDILLKPLVLNLRKATLDVCNAIAQWRDVLGYPAIYLWRGTSYLTKLSSDLDILASCEQMCRRFPCAIVGNPLLELELPNLQKVPLRNEAQKEKPLMPVKSSLLPPILRPAGQQPDGSVISPEMTAAAREMLTREPALYQAYRRETQVHSFELIDGTTFDANLIKQLKDIVFNEAHAALDFQFGSNANGVMDDLTPLQKMQLLAAVVIQKVWRGHVARRYAANMRVNHVAATKIQRLHRMIAAKQEVRLRRKRHLAAAKIQALARGVATRTALRKFFSLNGVATKIQTAWRAYFARKQTAFLRALTRCAKTLQRWYRGHLARRFVPAYKAKVYNSAAVQIQKIWKGGSLRVKHSASPKAIAAVIRIQTAWRRHVAVAYVKKLRAIRDAALTIQRLSKKPK